MNVTLDGCEDDFGFDGLRLTGHGVLDDGKGGLGSLRTHQKLREKNSPLFKALSDLIKSRNQLFIDEVQPGMVLEPFLCRGSSFFLHSPFDCLIEGTVTRGL